MADGDPSTRPHPPAPARLDREGRREGEGRPHDGAWLRTLGRLELLAGTPDAPGPRLLGPSKPLALLAYLALAPRRRATRDRLVSLLWGGTDPERARGTLRQTVWALRQKLGEDALVADGEEIELTERLEVDCLRFARAASDAAWGRAWAAYTGAFIPEFALMGGGEFEHWADQQRVHLAATWRMVGETLARTALDAARAQEAVPVLRALVDADPAPLTVWRQLLEAHLAVGDREGAQADAERLTRHLAEVEARPDGALRALLARCRRPTASPLAKDGPRRLELVGREAALATLLAGWRRAVGGRGGSVVMRAAAGLGKSRMLAEVQRRIEDTGGAVVTVRARSADREVPYALAATLAAAVAERPGAAGISAGSAEALVELAPGLSGTFRSAGRGTMPAQDAMRVRTLAVAELLQAVAEEAPLALLVDDLHWGDDASRQLIASLCERAEALPVQLVVTMRPLRGDWPVPQAATVSELLPLSAEQVEGLLAGMARGMPSLLAELGATFHAVSGGIPLLVVVALDLALERGWLRIRDDRWDADAPEAVRQALSRGSVLDQLLRDLPADALSMLVALALVRRPLPAAALRAVCGVADDGALLESLEQRGLLVPSGQGWDAAHERLGDAALTVIPTEARHAVAERLARALLAEPSPSARTWQVAGRLVADAVPKEAARCFRAWMELTQEGSGWRDPVGAASAFLGEEARVPEVRRLARSIGWRSRLRFGYPIATFALAMTLLMGLGGLLTVAGQRWLAPAAQQMVLAEPTTSRGFLWDPRSDLPAREQGARNPVPLRVTFLDGAGRRTANAPRRASVRMVEQTGAVRLGGTTEVAVQQGEADFGDLEVVGSGGFRLEVLAAGVPPARSRRLYAGNDGSQVDAARITILEGTVNGQRVDSLHREVRVAAGAPIDGALRVRALTDQRTAAILFGGVALWGDRTTQAFVLRALPPHGETLVHEPLRDAVTGRRWTAPRRPGRHAILLVADAETEMRFVASGTNWLLGTPRWNDGNDLADLSDAQLRQLERDGRLTIPRTHVADATLPLRPGATARTVNEPGRLVAAVLWVRVDAPGAARLP